MVLVTWEGAVVGPERRAESQRCTGCGLLFAEGEFVATAEEIVLLS